VLDDLLVQAVASRALDRLAAKSSTWTVHDIQQQVTMLVTEAGVRAAPVELRQFVEATTRLAASDCFSVLPPGVPCPEHVAHLTSLPVIAAEARLRDTLTALAAAGSDETSADPAMAAMVASRVAETGLDDEQLQAAAAVASLQPLVVVEGAAGAGKTTMLGAAISAAATEDRRVRIVTPTRKAAQVAADELGVPTDSVAALVYAHGYRCNNDGVWTRLAVGDIDPVTGRAFTGPPAEARLAYGERVVVDEAGMLDQDTALALLTVVVEAGATVALVGDRAQLPAVGRGGVLEMAVGLAPKVFDMAGVHRFTNHRYADLTIAMRQGDNPAAVFDRLHALGLVVLHDTDDARRDHIAHTVRAGEVVTVATNEQTREFNEAIRRLRVARGDVNDAHTVVGVDGLAFGAGDVIQTRKNDTGLGVVNRQTWTVRHVADDGAVYATENGTGRKHQRTVALPAEYVAAHAHLAYASTAYGVQGATVTSSHTMLSDVVSGASVYVAMTRGRASNLLHVVAGSLGEAREQFVDAMRRDRADRGLAHAITKAAAETAGLVADGPITVVNTEKARLRAIIQRTGTEAAKWTRAATALTEQEARHGDETARQQDLVTETAAHAADVLHAATAPLVDAATHDGAALADAQQRAAHTTQAARGVRGLRRRAATRAADTAREEHATLARTVQTRWGSAPYPGQDVTAWAHAAAESAATADPRVVAADQEATQARLDLSRLIARHRNETAALRREVFDGTTPAPRTNRSHRRPTALMPAGFGPDSLDMPRLDLTDPTAEAATWQHQAEAARTRLEQIDAMPIADAAADIRDRQQQQAERKAQAQRAAQQRRAPQPHDFTQRPPTTRPDPGERGIGR
jgi:hypothetical protein